MGHLATASSRGWIGMKAFSIAIDIWTKIDVGTHGMIVRSKLLIRSYRKMVLENKNIY